MQLTIDEAVLDRVQGNLHSAAHTADTGRVWPRLTTLTDVGEVAQQMCETLHQASRIVSELAFTCHEDAGDITLTFGEVDHVLASRART